MAGSLNHMVTSDGGFNFDHIENMGDAHEACMACFDIIAFLAEGNPDSLKAACSAARDPFPKVMPVFGKRSEHPNEE